MLRGPSATAATIAVVHSDLNPLTVLRALEENNEASIVRVNGRRDDNDPVSVTLDIYVQQQAQSSPEATAASTQTARETPHGTPACERKCSWVTLKQLRADLLLAIDDRSGSEYGELREFLEHCFERPTVFDRAWSGAMVLNASKVAHFVSTLVRLIRSRGHVDDQGIYDKLGAIFGVFLVPDVKKKEL